MSTVQEIEQAIRQLSPGELAELRVFLSEIDADSISDSPATMIGGHDETRSTPAQDSLSASAAEEWIDDLRAWAATRPPVVGPVDCSRDSIYEGRGE